MGLNTASPKTFTTEAEILQGNQNLHKFFFGIKFTYWVLRILYDFSDLYYNVPGIFPWNILNSFSNAWINP